MRIIIITLLHFSSKWAMTGTRIKGSVMVSIQPMTRPHLGWKQIKKLDPAISMR